MADLRILLIGLTLVACASAASFFAFPGNYPIVYFEDFKYIPTDSGYTLWYRTPNGVTRQEMAIVPYTPYRNDDSNPDTLGSSREGRAKSKLPLKNRKVSPKLLASLSG